MIKPDGLSPHNGVLQALLYVNNEFGIRQKRLATGKRINSAEDDPFNFSRSIRLNSEIRGKNKALENIQDAQNFLAFKEQHFTNIQSILLEMQFKAKQGVNLTLDTDSVQYINQELQSMADEITTIYTNATYGDALLSHTNPIQYLVGSEPDNTYLIDSNQPTSETITLGDFNEGIASWDALTGTGYIMYTEEDIYSRFGAVPVIERADNLVAVIHQGGQWYWSAWHGLTPFTPTDSDRLLAEVNFDADTVTHLSGTNSVIDGIKAGYDSGNLVITPNQFGNPPVASPDNFSVAGTQVTVTSATLAQAFSFSPSQLDVSTPSLANDLLSAIDIALDLIDSEMSIIENHQDILTSKGSLLINNTLNVSNVLNSITDADYAKERTELVRLQFLQDTGGALLAQAILDNNLVLQLLE